MKAIAVNILIAIVIVIAAFFIIQKKESVITGSLVEKINETRSEMEQAAKTTGLAQVDAEADTVVRDCGVRERYESLLGRLESLNNSELVEVQQLHAQCSHYYPTQKAFMVYKLEELFSEYTSLISVLESVRNVEPEEYSVDAWRSLVTKESTRATLLRQQYEIQGRIIEALVKNDTNTLNILLEDAKKVADSLNVTSIQINGERDALIRI